MYPLKFKPIYKEKIWGGRSLARKFARELPAGPIGESWEISSHGDDISIIANGDYAGLSLLELIAKKRQEVLGRELSGKNRKLSEDNLFPLLVKIIDARDNLSVQVHPDDAYAAKNEAGGSGKTELWYILNAEPGASIIYGLKDGVTRDQFTQAVGGPDFLDLLNFVPVKTGDYFYIPAGTVHAIGKGVMLAEIQQTSDLTYRLYDWDRTDDAGNFRELHIDKAIDVINFNHNQPGHEPLASGNQHQTRQTPGNHRQTRPGNLLIDNPDHQVRQLKNSNFFNVELINIFKRYTGNTKNRRFYIYMNLGSEVKINYSDGSLKVAKGESFLIPAALGHYEIVGQTRLLKAFLTD
ncbi:mannose-6-phosphate isomerase [Halanaerobiaceae bacterium Z-7014]|uniref:Phosphohexomutase n=1 Tax=Halonatronomonas betaini TaxID=2778430 RepID=A0A931AUS7_9FIRM|nr:type I phosphomannose isomerase catalytic subunit [Halonatronomonas betaini]MBF8436546.1 mannose-6-phosphate isomerase [Halonatronomonas betaini]